MRSLFYLLLLTSGAATAQLQKILPVENPVTLTFDVGAGLHKYVTPKGTAHTYLQKAGKYWRGEISPGAILFDSDLKQLTPEGWEISEFTNGLAVVRFENQAAMINENLEFAIPFGVYDYIRPIVNGYAVVAKDDKWGFINEKLEIVQPLLFEDASDAEPDGKAFVRNGGRRSKIKIKNKLKSPCIEGMQTGEGPYRVYVGSDCKFGFSTEKGKIIAKPTYDAVGSWNYNYTRVLVSKNGKWGWLDEKGNVVVEPIYDALDREGVAVKDGKKGFINFKGEVLLPFEYENVVADNDAWVIVKQNGKYGFASGRNIVVPIQYDEVRPYDYSMYVLHKDAFGLDDKWGYAAVKSNGKWGFIDRSNKMKLPMIFADVKSYNDGLVWASKDGHKYGAYDNKGAKILPLSFTDVSDFKYGMAEVTYKGRRGMIVPSGLFYAYKMTGSSRNISANARTARDIRRADNAPPLTPEQIKQIPNYVIEDVTRISIAKKSENAMRNETSEIAFAALNAGDYDSAYLNFRKAAEAGDSYAMLNVSDLLFRGQGCAKDIAQSNLWAQKAADAGLISATALLATRYNDGIGVAQDKTKAFELAKIAADAYSEDLFMNISEMEFYFILDAIELLAKDYYYGNPIPADYSEASSLASLAIEEAEMPDGSMHYLIGLMLLNGHGTEKDVATAKTFFEEGAFYNDADCKAILKTL